LSVFSVADDLLEDRIERFGGEGDSSVPRIRRWAGERIPD
jgi:hypothetical protein